MLLFIAGNENKITDLLQIIGFSKNLAETIVKNALAKYNFTYNVCKEKSIAGHSIPDDIIKEISSFRLAAEKSTEIQQIPII